MFLFRHFSKIPIIHSPLTSYLIKSSDRNFILEILKKNKEEIPKFKESQNLLKDLEILSIMRMRDFPNDKILSVIKAYTMNEQGTPRFYETLTTQIHKRINSFSMQELATIVFFLTEIPEAARIYDMVYSIIIADPLEIPADIIGKLSFSFSFRKSQNLDLHRALANIFCIANDKVSAENGFLFLTGLYRVNYSDPAVLPHIERWAKSNWEEFQGSEISHMIYIYFKFSMIESAIKKLEELDLEGMTASDIEKIIGCFLERNMDPPEKLVKFLLGLIQECKVTAVETVNLIYSLSSMSGTQAHFQALTELLEKTFHLISNQEKMLIFIGIISNAKENERILTLLQNEDKVEYSSKEIVSILPALVRRNNLFLPYTQGLLKTLEAQVQGKVLTTQELVVAMYSLSKLKYENPNFWEATLSAITLAKITSAEEYIQVKKTVKELASLGIDINSCIVYLESKYESNES